MITVKNFVNSILVLLLFGCSTENTSYLNKKYHGTTARYNGLFNANELLNGAITTFEQSYKDDFFELLPIEVSPNEEEVKGMLPAIDTAISKCTNVIRNHSMPSAAKVSNKDVEYNNWIDENWITIGKALYLKREYKKAAKNFEFIDKFFKDDPSKFTAEVWLSKIHIKEGKFAKAKLKLNELIEISESQKKRKLKDYLSYFKKKDKKKLTPPKLKKKLLFDIYKTSADLAIKSKDYDRAKEMLTLAISETGDIKKQTRLCYILGQLYESNGSLDSAAHYFGKSVKPSASFDIAFNGRLNQAICTGDKSMEKKLLKMAKDSKNAPYKDQIYYALSKISIKKDDIVQAKFYLTKSAFFSNSNKRQRAMSYEKLGDLTFNEKNYISAQKYYDSCSRYIDDKYPNGNAIKTKANKLSELVFYVEKAIYEDSVQRIALMSEKDRNEFIKDVLKKIKEDIQRKKEMEAQRLLELQDQQSNRQSKNSNKFVFNNPKLRDIGFEEFQRLWGPRENEDDWRRSNKIVFNESLAVDSDSSNLEEIDSNEEKDTLTVEYLLSKIPLNDSLYNLSVITKQEALYKSGLLYKDVLGETNLAEEQFKKAFEIKITNLTDLSNAFQLYRINEKNPEGTKYKKYIFSNYPDSDISKYLNDPDFYVKQKENEERDKVNYIQVLENYSKGKYNSVLHVSDSVIANNPENAFLSEYLLINALAFGQLNENKQGIVPKLERVINQKPGTPQAIRANEMLEIIKNGYSKNEKVEFEKKYIFNYIDGAEQYIFILVDENSEKKESLAGLMESTADFTSKKLKLKNLKVTSKMTLKNTSFVLVQKFESLKLAKEYVNNYKAGYENLGKYQDNKIYIINQENLKKLIETSKFDEYHSFYMDYY